MLAALMPGTKRNIISVELIPAADTVLRETANRTRLAKKDVIARMCEWFADQDVEVQKVVLGEIPDSLADAAKEIALRKLRGAKEDTIYGAEQAEPITPAEGSNPRTPTRPRKR